MPRRIPVYLGPKTLLFGFYMLLYSPHISLIYPPITPIKGLCSLSPGALMVPQSRMDLSWMEAKQARV